VATEDRSLLNPPRLRVGPGVAVSIYLPHHIVHIVPEVTRVDYGQDRSSSARLVLDTRGGGAYFRSTDQQGEGTVGVGSGAGLDGVGSGAGPVGVGSGAGPAGSDKGARDWSTLT